MGTDIVPFFFGGMNLSESLWLDGVPHYTRRAIGELAGLKYPRRSVAKIIERNPYIEEYAVDVRRTSTDGKEYLQKVYNPIGLQLVLFECRTPTAKRYKVAAAKLVWAVFTGTYRPYPESGDLRSALAQIESAPSGRKRRILVKELARQMGCSEQNIYSMIRKMRGGNLLTKGGRPKRSTQGSYRNHPEYKQTVDYLKDYPKAGGNRIKRELSLSVPAETINRWIRADGLRKSVVDLGRA